MRELLLELRQARAEAALQAAASGTRAWCMDMALAAPLAPTCDALPREPELLVLLDPLAGSALATLNTSTATRELKAEAPRGARQRVRFDPTTPGAAPSAAATASTPQGERRAAQPLPSHDSMRRDGPAAASAVQDRLAGPQAAMAQARPAMSSPARIAAWLARHAHLPTPAHHAAAGGDEGPSLAERQAGTNVVQLPLRREIGPAQRRPVAAPTEGVAARLLRWQQMLETPQARATLLGADTRGHAAEHTSSVAVAAPTAATTATALAGQRSRTLGELAAPNRPASPTPQAVVAAEPAALPPQALAAMHASLSRIEQRQLNATPSSAALATPEPTQWFDADDDALAERIHAILRRQALRHGIGGP